MIGIKYSTSTHLLPKLLCCSFMPAHPASRKIQKLFWSSGSVFALFASVFFCFSRCIFSLHADGGFLVSQRHGQGKWHGRLLIQVHHYLPGQELPLPSFTVVKAKGTVQTEHLVFSGEKSDFSIYRVNQNTIPIFHCRETRFLYVRNLVSSEKYSLAELMCKSYAICHKI